VAVPLVVVGAVIALPTLARLLPVGTTRAAPGLPAVVATRALVNWCFFGTDAFIPLAVVEVRGRSNLLAGLALTTSSLSWSACAWLQARLARRWSPRLLTASGNVLIGVGIVVTAAVLDKRVPVAIAFVGWAIAGAGMGFAFNTTSVAALDEAEPGEEGTTSSSLQMADALGIALSTGVGGAVVALGHRHGWSTASTLVIVFCITGAAVIPAVLAAWRIRDPANARATAHSRR
jgi:MFS family permease